MSAGSLRAAAFAASLLLCADAVAQPSRAEFESRRNEVAAAIGPATVLMLFSAAVQTYSLDIEFPFRQDSDLVYLTGELRPNTRLLLLGGPRPSSMLFLGDMSEASAARERSGIGTILPAAQFDRCLSALLRARPCTSPDQYHGELDPFFQQVVEGRAVVATTLSRQAAPSGSTPASVKSVLTTIRESHPDVSFRDVSELLAAKRQIKSPVEQETLAESARHAAAVILAAAGAIGPNSTEIGVRALVERACIDSGSDGWSFPAIVAAGANGQRLHHVPGRRVMRTGEMVIVDAGCSYQSMASDLARTVPVSGRFSAAQRAIYEIVYRAQQEGIAAAVSGKTIFDIERAMSASLAAGLIAQGVITKPEEMLSRRLYVPGMVHFVGLDVHDVGNPWRTLQPGMVLAIEPALYLPLWQMRPPAPPSSGASSADRDLYVRIEDMVIVTDGAPRLLAPDLPRTPEEIEGVMAKRGTP